MRTQAVKLADGNGMVTAISGFAITPTYEYNKIYRS